MSLAEIKKQINNTNKGDNSNSNRVDLLAARVAEVVMAEVNRFFEGEESIRNILQIPDSTHN